MTWNGRVGRWSFGALLVGAVGTVGGALTACSSAAPDAGLTGGACAGAACDGGMGGMGDATVDPSACGGASPTACADGKACVSASDCTSHVCISQTCVGATATDGVRNGSETDVDCGGSHAPPCAGGLACQVASDCDSHLCTGGVCGAATDMDGIKNGMETDVDCGGHGTAKRCADGRVCVEPADCASLECDPAHGGCQPATGHDGVKNGGESDVDCGGPDPATARCDGGKKCAAATDCDSTICNGGKCTVPSYSDGVMNGAETDVDCGGFGVDPRCDDGKTCKTCAAGKVCKNPFDCATGCDWTGHCAAVPSCIYELGGGSCGAFEEGDPRAVHESCCASVPIPGQAAGGTARLDKYLVTAGRMRAFVDRFGGDVQSYIRASTPRGWDAAWTSALPHDPNTAHADLGPRDQFLVEDPKNPNPYATVFHLSTTKTGCAVEPFDGVPGARTFWLDPVPGDPENAHYAKADLDPKALNCVTWTLAAAFCAWDGGRLPTSAELTAAFHNGGTTDTPWGASPADGAHVVHQFSGGYSYRFPKDPIAGALDFTSYVPAPGRKPLGNNASGAADLAGGLLEWVAGGPFQFAWKGAWSRAAYGVGSDPDVLASKQTDVLEEGALRTEASGIIGFRCAR